MSGPVYCAEVLELFERAPGAGRPDGPGWATGEAREPLTATHVRVHLRAQDGTVAAVRWEARGCPHTLAVLARAAQQLQGRPLDSAGVDVRALGAQLGAPVGKLGRFLVVQQAIERAALLLAAATA